MIDYRNATDDRDDRALSRAEVIVHDARS